MSLDKDVTTFTKISSKWIIFLNVKCNVERLLENNVVENLIDLGFGNDFLYTTPKTQSMKEKVNKLDIIKRLENKSTEEIMTDD